MTHPNPEDYKQARQSVASFAKYAPGIYMLGKVEAYADALRPSGSLRRYNRPMSAWVLNERRKRGCHSPYDFSSRAIHARICLHHRSGSLTLADHRHNYGTFFPHKHAQSLRRYL